MGKGGGEVEAQEEGEEDELEEKIEEAEDHVRSEGERAAGVLATLWAFARIGREPGERVMGWLEGRAVVLKVQYGCQECRQLHQYLLSCSLRNSSDFPQSASLLELREARGPASQDEFAKSDVHPSES